MGETPDRPPAGTSRAAGKGVRIFDRAQRWDRTKWLIALALVIAVVLVAVAFGRGM
jgi:hypothetical protein